MYSRFGLKSNIYHTNVQYISNPSKRFQAEKQKPSLNVKIQVFKTHTKPWAWRGFSLGRFRDSAYTFIQVWAVVPPNLSKVLHLQSTSELVKDTVTGIDGFAREGGNALRIAV